MLDIRKVGIHPDFWHPVAWSDELKPGRLRGVSFAGEAIVLARAEDGEAFALEDRCAHRQVPLRLGMLSADRIRCGYHGWTFDKTGRCVEVPSLGRGQEGGGAAVRRYPCREAWGLVFVFPGDPAKAETTPLPQVPAAADPAYKTRRLTRRIRCHYSFMHENLMDMNHQFLHRSLMGSIQPVLLSHQRGGDWVEAVYRFDRTAGRQSWGEKFMIGRRAQAPTVRQHDVMVVRTQYPYQTLTFARADSAQPALDLWLSYVPVDRDQRVNHSFGLMSIRRPSWPGLIHLFWPAICAFTDGIFRQDQNIVEQEQRAHDRQGRDENREIFPVINCLREVLRSNGVPLGSGGL